MIARGSSIPLMATKPQTTKQGEDMEQDYFYVIEEHFLRTEPDGTVRGPFVVSRLNFESYRRLHNSLMGSRLYARIIERDLFGREIVTYKRIRNTRLS